MKITVTRKPAPPVQSQYPCLKQYCYKGRVVLFVAPRTGIVVQRGDGSYNVGDFSQKWAEEEYLPFHGSVTFES